MFFWPRILCLQRAPWLNPLATKKWTPVVFIDCIFFIYSFSQGVMLRPLDSFANQSCMNTSINSNYTIHVYIYMSITEHMKSRHTTRKTKHNHMKQTFLSKKSHLQSAWIALEAPNTPTSWTFEDHSTWGLFIVRLAISTYVPLVLSCNLDIMILT